MDIALVRRNYMTYDNVIIELVQCWAFLKLYIDIETLIGWGRVDGHHDSLVGLAQIVRVKHEAVRTVVGCIDKHQLSGVDAEAHVKAHIWQDKIYFYMRMLGTC